jgi:hypothetical protein
MRWGGGKVAFVLSFGEEGPDFDVHGGPTRAYVAFSVGFDPELGTTYTLAASLERPPAVAYLELSFWVQVDYEDGSEETLWDGTQTRFIASANRAVIHEALLVAIRRLVNTVRPKQVVMATAEDVPEAGLRKYRAINTVFTSEGYEVTEQPPIYGTRSWFMERAGAGDP